MTKEERSKLLRERLKAKGWKPCVERAKVNRELVRPKDWVQTRKHGFLYLSEFKAEPPTWFTVSPKVTERELGERYRKADETAVTRISKQLPLKLKKTFREPPPFKGF